MNNPRSPYWKLDGHIPKPISSVLEWAESFEKTAIRRVDETFINQDVRVSTVFLGIDHNFNSDGPPILFETMIFGGPHDGDQWEYSDWDSAVLGHASAVIKATSNGGLNEK